MAALSEARRAFGVPFDEVLQRAFTFHDLVTPRLAVFTGVDPTITSAWLADLKAEAEDVQKLSGIAVRRAEAHQVLLTRDEALAESRGLMQDLFYYAGRAYPRDGRAAEIFGRKLYTSAGHSPEKLNAALQVAATQAADPEHAALLTAAGWPAAKATRLQQLAEAAQQRTTDVNVEESEQTVETDRYVDRFNGLWARVRQVAAAAVVAYRHDAASRRLFRLYPNQLEEHMLTTNPARDPSDTTATLHLDDALSPTRVLSITVEAAGGPVRVGLVQEEGDPLDKFLELASSEPRRPHRVPVQELGAASSSWLKLENPTKERATLIVRVLED